MKTSVSSSTRTYTNNPKFMTKTRQALFTNCQNFVLPFLQTGLTVLSTPKRNLKVVQWVLNSPKKWSFNSIKQRLISQKIMFNQKWQIYWHFEKLHIKSKSTKKCVVFFWHTETSKNLPRLLAWGRHYNYDFFDAKRLHYFFLRFPLILVSFYLMPFPYDIWSTNLCHMSCPNVFDH